MDIKITKSNGDIFTLSSLGFTVKDFVPSTVEIRSNYEVVDNAHGLIDIGSTYGQRLITIPLEFSFLDNNEYVRKRDLLHTLFSDNKPFYVEELRNPEGLQYKFRDTLPNTETFNHIGFNNLAHKKYKVRMRGAIELADHYRYSATEITLETVGLPFAESVNVITKTFSTNNFVFNNQGTTEINMREQSETEVLFTGTSSNLSIKNMTTGNTWSYNGVTGIGDVVRLSGVRATKNNISIFKETNKKMIDLTVGNNKFEISGVSGVFELAIRTRFYFL